MLHLFSLLFLVHYFVELAFVIRLTLSEINLSRCLLALVHFRLVMNNCAPLVEVASDINRVVPSLLIRQRLDAFLFLMHRFLDPVRHFQSIHNGFGTSLHFIEIYLEIKVLGFWGFGVLGFWVVGVYN